MTARNISIRMDEDRIEQIDSLAKNLNRSRAWVVNEAAARYLSYEQWFIEQVEDGLESSRTNPLRDSDDVFAHLQSKIDRAKTR